MLFRGPSGVGESTLAQNLGQRALEEGKSVAFSTVNAALADSSWLSFRRSCGDPGARESFLEIVPWR